MDNIEYVNLPKRTIAFIIDSIVLFAIFLVIFLPISILNEFAIVYYGGYIYDPSKFNDSYTLFFISVCIYWLYFAVMESSSKQATFGKILLNIKVSQSNGSRITFFRATARYFLKYISSLFLGTGILMILSTKKDVHYTTY